jgi:hypothetical protein
MPANFYRSSHSPIRVFISHAEPLKSEDSVLLQGLVSLLHEKREGIRFHVSSSLDLQPGDVIKEKLAEGLATAQIIVLFVTSDYINSVEMSGEISSALRQRESGRAIVIPVILTEDDWSDTGFANLVPIKPTNLAHKSLYKSEIIQQVQSSLVTLVKSRFSDPVSGEPEINNMTLPRPLDFRSLWTYLSVLLVLGSLVALFGFSDNPAVHNINPARSPSPSKFFIDSLVIGIAAMSVLQVFRRLVRMRGAFHKDLVLEWLGEPAASQLYKEVGAKRIRNMFDLPSELLTGQLSAIAEQVLEKQRKDEPNSPLIERMAAENDADQRLESNDADEGRVNLALVIQRNLDQFQISASAGWRRYLLLTSILLSMGLFVIGLPLLNTGSFITALNSPALSRSQQIGNFALLLGGTLLTGLFGGFLGSIARDVVAIIEKLRQ